MSDSSNSLFSRILAVIMVVLLAILLYASFNYTTTLREATSKIESAAAAEQASEATLIARAETAVAAAETAVAKVETGGTGAELGTTSSPSPPKAGDPLDGGVALSCQTGDGFDAVLYHSVDRIEVFQAYADFQQEWQSSGQWDHPGAVQSALIETEVEAGQWELFYSESLASGCGTEWSGWSEYMAFKVVGEADGESVMRIESPRRALSGSTSFPVGEGLTIGGSLIDLEDQGAKLTLSSRLLLADKSDGETKYILVILDPGASAGGNQCSSWCSNCQGVYCWLCSFCG
jgi:hypothetical protein